jgi:uptake hydrogenase large subunit
MTTGTNRIVFSPFARLEGDIRIEVQVLDGLVAEARASGKCYRGFEAMLRGRDVRDAMVITPRVCGQCSLAHLAASAAAIASISGVAIPPNGILTTAVMLAAETVLNHFTHFYLSFAPDLSADAPDDDGAGRFRPTAGSSFQAAVEARREILPLLGLFAGKWPNSLAIQPGGTTRNVDRSDVARATGVVLVFEEYLRTRFLKGDLDEWMALEGEADLSAWLENDRHAESDLGVFLAQAAVRGLDRLGRGPGAYVAWDGLGSGSTRPHAPPSAGGTSGPVRLELVSEHVRFAWYEPADKGEQPSRGRTIPAPDRPDAYSWIKAPRLGGRPAEAGPLARMVRDGDPLIRDLLDKRGAGVLVRELARLHEMLRLVAAIRSWLGSIRTGEPFLATVKVPESGEGVGVIEAPRGMLGHWVSLKQGKIHEYQIVTPTAWNFSPRDDDGVPGPVESALVGAAQGEVGKPGEATFVVKSFDPCLFCAVH